MRLKVLGTGTCNPSVRRGSPAYVVSEGALTILVDAGPAVAHRLVEFGYSVLDIDVVVVTHFHVDHTADLATLFFAYNYGVVPRQKPLLVIGGEGIERLYENLQNLYPWVEPKSYRLSLETADETTIEKGGMAITTGLMNHRPESIGVRVSRGEKSITFTGDTDYSENLVTLARNTDVLVAECSFPEKKVPGHMNLEVLNRVVTEARPRRVILSHLYPDWEDFRGVLHAPYLLGEDGLEIDL